MLTSITLSQTTISARAHAHTHTQKVPLTFAKPHSNPLKQISGNSKRVWFLYYTRITEGVITVHVPPTLG
jgi:hypothetical protein